MMMRLTGITAVGMSAAWFSLVPRSTHTDPDAIGAAFTDIAFSSRRDGNWEIYVMDAAGRNQTRLTRRDVEDRFPLWSPDRRRIAFASLVGGTWELWVMDADGTKQKRLASHIVVKSTRGWSRDNKRIAFAAGADSNVDIHTVDATSGEVKRLTTSQGRIATQPGHQTDPSWHFPRRAMVRRRSMS